MNSHILHSQGGPARPCDVTGSRVGQGVDQLFPRLSYAGCFHWSEDRTIEEGLQPGKGCCVPFSLLGPFQRVPRPGPRDQKVFKG